MHRRIVARQAILAAETTIVSRVEMVAVAIKYPDTLNLALPKRNEALLLI